jgi:major membrane immunogen (membrane-anchored lipoprotein)
MMHKNSLLYFKNKILNLLIINILIIALFSHIFYIANAEQNPPSNFNAEAFSRFGIALSWTNNEDNNTYIEWNSSKSWDLGEGAFLYNGINTNYNHINLPAGTQFFYQVWSYNVTENSYSSTYQEANATTYPNQLPTQTNPNPSNNSENISITQPTVKITIQDPEGDSINWTIQDQYLINNASNNDSNGTKSASLLIPLPYSTQIVWYVNTTDGIGWTNTTYKFTTRNQYIPNTPNPFTANTYNRTQINLSWTKGTKADTTYIEWNTTETWTKGQGKLLYNNTGTNASHTGLNYYTKYYYKAWSWNNTDKIWSTTSSNDSATTNPNIAPNISGEIPANHSTNIVSNPTLQVTVDDFEHDSLDVYWYSNVSGSWTLFATNLDINTTGGPVDISGKNANFSNYSTKYWWSVRCFDGTNWTNQTYDFTRSPNYPPTISNPNPGNGSTNINPTPVCNVTVTDVNEDNMTVYIYENSTRISGTLYYQVSYDVDDAYYFKDAPENSNTFVMLNFIGDYKTIAGLRFRNVQIPQGATIISANLYTRVKYYANSDDANCTIYGDDIDNSDIIEGGQSLASRSLTTANVLWHQENLGYSWVESPNVSSIIQEIINRPGWVKGNNITIITNDTQSIKNLTIYDYQDSNSNAAKLNITYYTDISIWSLQKTIINVAPGSNIIWDKFQNATKYNAMYWWSVNATDGLKWTNITYHFKTREQHIPNQPSNFIATSINSSKINLTWTKGSKADYTRIQRKTGGYPSSISDGTNVYNGTGSSYSDTGLTQGTTYYYSAWSYNFTDNEWSTSVNAYNTTNNKPSISNPIPVTGSTGTDIAPQMNITVNDLNGDLMTIQWYSNLSGSWNIFGTNNTVSNGTYHQTNTNFSEYGKTYWWNVTVSDGKDTNISNTFYFKINSKPTISNIWPTNNSIGIRLTPPLNVSVFDFEGDKMTIQWYSNISGDWVVFNTNINVNNGTYFYTNTNFSSYNTTYWLYITVSDGKTTNSSPILHFTTNNVPRITNPYPENESNGIKVKPIMNITIDDRDNDSMTIKWYSNSSGSWQQFGTNSSVLNGTYHQVNANFKKYNTTYWWYVTVNDGKDNTTSDIFKFTTMLNNAPLVYGEGPVNNSENSKTVPILNVTVNDPNKDLLDVFWYSNTSGSWILFATNVSIDPTNNPVNISQKNSNFSKYTTKYWWSVNVTDGTDWVNNTYCFTTMENSIPTVSNIKPINGSVNLSIIPQLNAQVNDLNGDLLNIYWYSNSSGPWALFNTNLSIDTSSNPVNITQINSNFSKYNTTYWWSVNVTDGTDWVNKTNNLTTKINTAPKISNPIPTDGKTDVCNSPINFSINISDFDGDTMTIALKTNASGSWITFNSTTNIVNGSYSFTNTSWVSKSGTKYWWSVNVTDNTTWVNKTFNFTTNYKPTISNALPNNGSVINPQPVCNVTVIDNDGDLVDVYFYEKSTNVYSLFDSKISNDTDDAYYLNGMQNDKNEIKLNDKGTAILLSGLRFKDVQIPQGATITNATLNVWVYGSNYDDPDITFYGHNTDDSPTIEGSTGQDELINRILTTSNVQWIDQGIGNGWRRSPDISNIIQEIVNRPGWKKGNNITIITKDTQSAKIFSIADYSSNSTYAVELNISYIPWVLQQTNYAVVSNSNIVWNKYTNASLFDTKYWWAVHANDGCIWTNETYSFTIRSAFIPDPPISFNASAKEKNCINLSWVNNENNTYIEWNTIESWAPRKGTFIINTSSNTNYNHSGRDADITYYYQAWGYNTTDQVFSQTYLSANATAYGNNIPAFTNENPKNNLTNLDINYSKVSIDINDKNGDKFNWTIQGKYLINNISNYDSNGTKNASLISPLPFNTKIIWYVNATDGYSTRNETYNFTTRAQYIPSEPTNFIAITHNKTQINLSWEYSANITYIEWNTTESWTKGQGKLLYNNTGTNVSHPNLNSNTKYYYKAWRYNITDNVFSNTSANSSAITNHPPIFGVSSPANGSENQKLSFTWSISITDADNDNFNWTIQCSNNQSNNLSNDTNGIKKLQLFNLSYYTLYIIRVNATDGCEWNNATYIFTTLDDDIPFQPPSNPQNPITDTIPPTAPTNVKCTTPETNNTPSFSWYASTDDTGINGYYVKIDNGNDIWIGNKLTWTATTAIEDGTHIFYVKAEDSSLNLNIGSNGFCTFTIKSSSGSRPVANAGGPYYGLTYKAIQFDGSRSYDPDGVITSGIWDFGNGTTAKGVKPTYNFTEPGQFNATLTITDNDGLTDNDTTTVTIYLDSDRDGWSDDLEKSYGTNPSDPSNGPLDTDGDGIPDNSSPDGKYIGDFDDDGDGLRDDYESLLGSDPKNNLDVISVNFNGSLYFLVDINKDGQKDIFYDYFNETSTELGVGINEYFIDINNDGKWEIIYNLISGEITSYHGEKLQSIIDSWVLIVLITLIIISLVILIVVYLFKIGYLYIDYIPVKGTKKKNIKQKSKKSK